MADFGLNLALHSGILVIFVLLLSAATGRVPRALWLGAALLVFAIYALAVMQGGKLFRLEGLQPIREFLTQSKFNWAGKLVSIACTLAMTALAGLVIRDIWRRAGFTLRQAPGSLVPAVIAIAVLLSASIGVELWAKDGADPSLDVLLFQGLAPGLDEEPMFRGLLLLLLNEALRGEGRKLLGFSLGGLASTVLFGVVHGVGFAGGELQVSAIAIAFTGVTGLGLLWIRERTGSLLLPIVAHNAINLSHAFF